MLSQRHTSDKNTVLLFGVFWRVLAGFLAGLSQHGEWEDEWLTLAHFLNVAMSHMAKWLIVARRGSCFGGGHEPHGPSGSLWLTF
jgi:hypothetical protein